MAKLYITEFAGPGGRVSPESGFPLVSAPALVEQTALTIGTAVASAAFGASTRIVRLQAAAACFVQFGTAPTAVTDKSMPLAANVAEYFAVSPGHKVSVIV